MDWHSSKRDLVQEDGWEIVADGWWRIRFESVSWSYSQENPTAHFPKPPHNHESLICASFPKYASSRLAPEVQTSVVDEEVSLNPKLVGVLCAMDAVISYETDVGFYSSTALDVHLDEQQKRPDISVDVEEHILAMGKERWDELVENLFRAPTLHQGSVVGGCIGEVEESRDLGHSSRAGSLGRSTSTFSSIELTDSDLSVHSISAPSTPKGKGFESNVEVKAASPPSHNDPQPTLSSPSKPLNASASSFVPSLFKPEKPHFITFPSPAHPITPSPQPTYANFTFPSLDVPPFPIMNIKKDENGFYNEVDSLPPPQSSRPASPLLPPFLQERRRVPVSKTRAMVERLRSSYQSQDSLEDNSWTDASIGMSTQNFNDSPSPSPGFWDRKFFQERQSVSEDGRDPVSGVSSPPTPDEDEDGWINLTEGEKISRDRKARRTRALFLALTRRRSDSLPPRQPSGSQEGKDCVGRIEDVEIPITSSPLSSYVSLPSVNDGWIEEPALPSKVMAQPRAEARSRTGRKRRSSSNSTSTTSHFIPTGIPTPHAGIHPGSPLSASFSASSPAPCFYPSFHPMISYASYVRTQMRMRASGGHGATSPGIGEWPPYFYPIQQGFAPAKSLTGMSTSMDFRPSTMKLGSRR